MMTESLADGKVSECKPPTLPRPRQKVLLYPLVNLFVIFTFRPSILILALSRVSDSLQCLK